jgi:hypothetical protein
VANTPYTVGNASSTGWSNFSPPNDLWYVVPVQVLATANVVAIRLIGRAAGGLARMALWQDSSNAPGAFVAQTDNITLSAGVGSDAPVPLATQVVGGQRYWIGAKFANNAAIYQNSGSGTVYTLDQGFSLNPSTTLNPFPAASAGQVGGVALNFYLLVQDVSL